MLLARVPAWRRRTREGVHPPWVGGAVPCAPAWAASAGLSGRVVGARVWATALGTDEARRDRAGLLRPPLLLTLADGGIPRLPPLGCLPTARRRTGLPVSPDRHGRTLRRRVVGSAPRRAWLTLLAQQLQQP